MPLPVEGEPLVEVVLHLVHWHDLARVGGLLGLSARLAPWTLQRFGCRATAATVLPNQDVVLVEDVGQQLLAGRPCGAWVEGSGEGGTVRGAPGDDVHVTPRDQPPLSVAEPEPNLNAGELQLDAMLTGYSAEPDPSPKSTPPCSSIASSSASMNPSSQSLSR